MRVAPADSSTFLLNVTLLVFTMTLVLSLHSEKTTPSPSLTQSEKDSHSLHDTSDLSELILHTLAYFISCFAVTVFLLICAAIILGMATVLMEMVVEAFRSTYQMVHDARSRRERARRMHEAESSTEPLDDICSDTWNYR